MEHDERRRRREDLRETRRQLREQRHRFRRLLSRVFRCRRRYSHRVTHLADTDRADMRLRIR